jgi:hypothetical protein
LRGVYSIRRLKDNRCEYFPVGSFEEPFEGVIKDTVNINFDDIIITKNNK